MEKTTILLLDRNVPRPVFDIESPSGISFTCMFDTGADTPVWCSGLDMFRMCFPDSEKIEREFLLGGFGTGVAKVGMYRIPEFRLKDLLFKNFHVAIDNKRRFAWDLVLCYTLFTKMDYSIRNIGQKTPLLQITHDRDSYGTGIIPFEKGDHLARRMYSFSDEF